MAFSKLERRFKIKTRIRSKVLGTAERPRMTVFRSNKQSSVQLIDDNTGKTLIAASTLAQDIAAEKGTKTEMADKVDKAIADMVLAAGVVDVEFDRNGYLYQG